jgi:transketolase
LPVIDPAAHDVYAGVSKGAYVLVNGGEPREEPHFQNVVKNPYAEDAPILQVVLIGAGSELWPCVEAAKLLATEGIHARVVSFPSWEIFDEQTAEYKASVLPAGVPRLAVEAGATAGWWKYTGLDGDVIGLDRFGASAPGPKVLAELGFSAENVAARAKKLVK